MLRYEYTLLEITVFCQFGRFIVFQYLSAQLEIGDLHSNWWLDFDSNHRKLL